MAPAKRVGVEAKFTTPRGTDLLVTLPAFAVAPRLVAQSASVIATPKR